MTADPGLDGRSSRVTGAFISGSCSRCEAKIMAVRPADAAVEGAVLYVEACAREDASAFVSNDGLLHEGAPAWATLLVRPHSCFTPAAPPPPAPAKKAAAKVPAKKAPARSRKKETP